MEDLTGPTRHRGRSTAAKIAHRLNRANLLARWRGSTLLRQRLVSLGHLLAGNFGGVVIMMVTLAIATRALGAEAFGAFAIILTIARTCERLIRFESWQPLIRFIAAEEKSATPDRLASLYAYGLLLDIASALAAALLAVIVSQLLGPVVGLAPEHRYLVAIYALAIACNLRGMASAALRLAGRFRVLAYVQMAAFVLRFVLAIALYLLGAGLAEFIVAWTLSQVFDALLFNYQGLRALHEAGVPSPWRANMRRLPEKFPGFIRFAISTNLSSGMRTLTHEMDTLLVSTLVGPSAAGLYYLSRRIAKVVQTAGDLLQTIIYPDLARLWNQVSRGAMQRLVTILQVALAAIGLVAIALCWLVGLPLLQLAFGADFAGSYAMLLAQLFAIMLMLHSAPARSALLAMNRPTFVLGTSLLASICFFATATFLLPRIGAIGANYAHIVFGIVTALLLDVAFHKGLRPKAGKACPAPASKDPSP